MSSVKKLYDIHIEYEDGKKYSKYDIKYENLKFNSIFSVEFSLVNRNAIKEFKIIQQKNLTIDQNSDMV
tara:strand:- start:858 stop:1064 length:207 start_codon:yes stop_codon:yes gene_type:complete